MSFPEADPATEAPSRETGGGTSCTGVSSSLLGTSDPAGGGDGSGEGRSGRAGLGRATRRVPHTPGRTRGDLQEQDAKHGVHKKGPTGRTGPFGRPWYSEKSGLGGGRGEDVDSGAEGGLVSEDSCTLVGSSPTGPG